MNIIEKSVWLHKVPKNKRSELKMLLSRNNFHEIRDIGNEDYVINIINQDYVVDRENCEGELYVLSASSRYEIKNLRYSLRFADKNEMVLQKPENLYLTESEDIALDRYMASFCSTIKRELDYQVAYGVKIVEPQPQYQPQPVQQPVQQPQTQTHVGHDYGYNPVQPQAQINTNQIQPQAQINTNQNVNYNPNTQMNLNTIQNNQNSNNYVQQNMNQEVQSPQFDLNTVYSSINAPDNAKISLTAYCKDGIYGVNIDVNNDSGAEIDVAKDANLDDINKLRALTTCIFIAQGLGSFLRLKNPSYDIKFFYFEDSESSVQPPANFIDLSTQVSQIMN